MPEENEKKTTATKIKISSVVGIGIAVAAAVGIGALLYYAALYTPGETKEVTHTVDMSNLQANNEIVEEDATVFIRNGQTPSITISPSNYEFNYQGKVEENILNPDDELINIDLLPTTLVTVDSQVDAVRVYREGGSSDNVEDQFIDLDFTNRIYDGNEDNVVSLTADAVQTGADPRDVTIVPGAEFSYLSSNPEVVVAYDNGMLHPVGPGLAKVYAVTTYNNPDSGKSKVFGTVNVSVNERGYNEVTDSRLNTSFIDGLIISNNLVGLDNSKENYTDVSSCELDVRFGQVENMPGFDNKTMYVDEFNRGQIQFVMSNDGGQTWVQPNQNKLIGPNSPFSGGDELRLTLEFEFPDTEGTDLRWAAKINALDQATAFSLAKNMGVNFKDFLNLDPQIALAQDSPEMSVLKDPMFLIDDFNYSYTFDGQQETFTIPGSNQELIIGAEQNGEYISRPNGDDFEITFDGNTSTPANIELLREYSLGSLFYDKFIMKGSYIDNQIGYNNYFLEATTPNVSGISDSEVYVLDSNFNTVSGTDDLFFIRNNGISWSTREAGMESIFGKLNTVGDNQELVQFTDFAMDYDRFNDSLTNEIRTYPSNQNVITSDNNTSEIKFASQTGYYKFYPGQNNWLLNSLETRANNGEDLNDVNWFNYGYRDALDCHNDETGNPDGCPYKSPSILSYRYDANRVGSILVESFNTDEDQNEFTDLASVMVLPDSAPEILEIEATYTLQRPLEPVYSCEEDLDANLCCPTPEENPGATNDDRFDCPTPPQECINVAGLLCCDPDDPFAPPVSWEGSICDEPEYECTEDRDNNLCCEGNEQVECCTENPPSVCCDGPDQVDCPTVSPPPLTIEPIFQHRGHNRVIVKWKLTGPGKEYYKDSKMSFHYGVQDRSFSDTSEIYFDPIDSRYYTVLRKLKGGEKSDKNDGGYTDGRFPYQIQVRSEKDNAVSNTESFETLNRFQTILYYYDLVFNDTHDFAAEASEQVDAEVRDGGAKFFYEPGEGRQPMTLPGIKFSMLNDKLFSEYDNELASMAANHGNTAAVRNMYVAIHDRIYDEDLYKYWDSEGVKFWVGEIEREDANRIDLDGVKFAMTISPEYREVFVSEAANEDRAIADFMYQVVLKRGGDAEGVSYLVDNFPTEFDKRVRLAQSPEYTDRITEIDREQGRFQAIVELYETIFGRAADVVGVSYWDGTEIPVLTLRDDFLKGE